MYLVYLLTSFCALLTTCRADLAAFFSNAGYNNGDYGRYVSQTFVSNPAVTSVPVLNFMKPFTTCDDGSYIFIAPRGDAVNATPMILDPSGSPVWAATKSYGEIYNVQVQHYRGQPYITFWGGDDAVLGHGIGQYYMLDQQYKVVRVIKAANGLGGDLHEFTITSDDTALFTIYQKSVVDVSSKTSWQTSGWIWDSMFQEIDIETGQAIFEWRASTHVPLTDSFTNVNAATEDDPWDVYHINSVEKDDLGNYLISVRFLRSILYIDGRSGQVLWQLGGINNSFEDLSNGKATAFLGQHHAHWHEGRRYITFFDNRADWYNTAEERSKGTKIEVDLDKMTARLAQTYHEPIYKILSNSQGSYQTLPNGNVLLGYGNTGVVAEFSAEGDLLCDAYFQPASSFSSNDVQSYRNLKFNWTAWPDTQPDLVLQQSTLYASWNGATEAETWLLLGSDEHDEQYEEGIYARSANRTILIDKSGFETEYHIYEDDNLPRFLRVVALDKNSRPLGTSNVVDIGDLAQSRQDSELEEEYVDDEDHAHSGDYAYFEGVYLEKDINDWQVLLGLGILTGLSVLLVVLFMLGRTRIAEGWEAVAERLPDAEQVVQSKTRLLELLRRIRASKSTGSFEDDSSDCSVDDRLLGTVGYETRSTSDR